MDVVWLDIAQYSLVVGDYHYAHLGSNQTVYAFSDDFDRIYVQAGVCFVQDGYFRLQHGKLENFTGAMYARPIV